MNASVRPFADQPITYRVLVVGIGTLGLALTALAVWRVPGAWDPAGAADPVYLTLLLFLVLGEAAQLHGPPPVLGRGAVTMFVPTTPLCATLAVLFGPSGWVGVTIAATTAASMLVRAGPVLYPVVLNAALDIPLAIASGAAAAAVLRALPDGPFALGAAVLAAYAVLRIPNMAVMVAIPVAAHRSGARQAMRTLYATGRTAIEFATIPLLIALVAFAVRSAPVNVLLVVPVLVLPEALARIAGGAAAAEASGRADALTGLPAHTAIMDALAERLGPRHGRTGVLMIDIDRFKTLNDRTGHQAGDQTLVDVARTLRRSVHAGDFVGRYGGEEFTVIVSGVNPHTASAIGERLRATVAALPSRITISVGVACATGQVSPHAVLAAADRALYIAKRGGRNRVHLDPVTITQTSRPRSRTRAAVVSP